MAIGALRGYTLQTLGGLADHTYATSSAGHVWPCWGRSAGGAMLCDGDGSVEQADCLSLPDSQAGISYAVTGVCHQTANRILLPAGLTVASARGAVLSILLYGVYGRDRDTGQHHHPSRHPWPELSQCRVQHGHP